MINVNDYAIDENSGEIIGINKIVPIGSIIFTLAQQEAYRKKREREQKRADKRRTSNVLGNFYFILAENPFFDLKPETVTKLIMLCSYLNYDNSFMLTQRIPMRKSDVQSVLKVSRSTAYNFYKEVAPKYINDVNGQLFLSDNTIFIKGKINNPNYKHYQQFYVDSVRRLYNSTPNKHHAQLGYIFKLLPYINIEFNILCHNPFEEQINQIKPLTITDFCESVGYNKTQFSRLIKIYKNITFDVNGQSELFVSYIWNGGCKDDSLKIYVNPHILYAGLDYKRVEILGEFCSLTNNNSTFARQDKTLKI